tara:strand:+ start:2985 stop:3194 length:210 start_codon:yes stop_codon:yes gene_type:complete
MEVEKLDVENIFEIQIIRSMIKHRPELLSIFEILLIMSNNRLNDECKIVDNKPPTIEENIDPVLDSDSD